MFPERNYATKILNWNPQTFPLLSSFRSFSLSLIFLSSRNQLCLCSCFFSLDKFSTVKKVFSTILQIFVFVLLKCTYISFISMPSMADDLQKLTNEEFGSMEGNNTKSKYKSIKKPLFWIKLCISQTGQKTNKDLGRYSIICFLNLRWPWLNSNMKNIRASLF